MIYSTWPLQSQQLQVREYMGVMTIAPPFSSRTGASSSYILVSHPGNSLVSHPGNSLGMSYSSVERKSVYKMCKNNHDLQKSFSMCYQETLNFNSRCQWNQLRLFDRYPFSMFFYISPVELLERKWWKVNSTMLSLKDKITRKFK